MDHSIDRLCPLCPPALAQNDSYWVWYAWKEGGEDAVAERSRSELGEPVTAEVARRHCNEHHPLQAPAERSLSRKQALELVAGYNERDRAVLELAFRVRALSSDRIARLFFLQENQSAARPNAARTLRRLVADDLLYRVHLEHLPGAGPRPRKDPPALYFLGRQARAQIGESYGRRPRKREEWLNEVSDLGAWDAPYQLWRSSLPPMLLYQQLEYGPTVGVRESRIDGWQLRFDAANWFDSRFVSMLVADPMSQHRRIRADGLCAFGLCDPDGRQALIPLLYYRDLETRSPERYLERLHAHAAIPRTREINDRFPDVPLGTPIPALVICESPARVRALAEASRRLFLPPETAVIGVDRTTAASHGLAARCWQPLFKTEVASPVDLIKGLTSGATGRAGIDWKARLRSTY